MIHGRHKATLILTNMVCWNNASKCRTLDQQTKRVDFKGRPLLLTTTTASTEP